MYPSKFFLCLAAVMILQQSGVAAHVSSLDAFIEVNTTVLDKFVQNKIDQAFGDHPFLFNLNTTVLTGYIKLITKQMFADQPLIKMFVLEIHDSRIVSLHRKTFHSSTRIADISIVNPSNSSTSSNNLLAYRPRFSDLHDSNLAGIFLNAKELTCGSTLCKVLPHEGDGFNKGRQIIEAGDRGNDLEVFSSTKYISTFGFAIVGCPEMNRSCLPDYYDVTIMCYVPPDCV